MTSEKEMLKMAVRLRTTVIESKMLDATAEMLEDAANIMEDAAPMAACPVRPGDRVYIIVWDGAVSRYSVFDAYVHAVIIGIKDWGVQVIWWNDDSNPCEDYLPDRSLSVDWCLKEEEARKLASLRTDKWMSAHK